MATMGMSEMKNVEFRITVTDATFDRLCRHMLSGQEDYGDVIDRALDALEACADVKRCKGRRIIVTGDGNIMSYGGTLHANVDIREEVEVEIWPVKPIWPLDCPCPAPDIDALPQPMCLINRDLLAQAIETVEDWLCATCRSMAPAARAELIADLYEVSLDEADDDDDPHRLMEMAE